jgi:Domain of unknown function (DUF4406)
MKTYYLAGPMTGIPKFNFPAFIGAAAKLREAGYTIISPAELDSPEMFERAMASPDGAPGSGSINFETWGDFLARDVKLVADSCHGIILLPDWWKSRGARLEAYVGLLCGHEFFQYNHLSPSMLIRRPARMVAYNCGMQWL